MSYRFQDGDLVSIAEGFSKDLPNAGKIRGFATMEMATIGRMWIVEVLHWPNNDYPFRCVTIPENALTYLDNVSEK